MAIKCNNQKLAGKQCSTLAIKELGVKGCHNVWFLFVLATDDTVCAETHLGGEGNHSNLDTHTPTFHAQTQMEHNSSPPGGGMKVWLVVKNQNQDLLQWSTPPVGKECQESVILQIPCKNDVIHKPLAYALKEHI